VLFRSIAPPDLGPIRSASRTVGANLAPGAIVAYESTVYPGLTEEVCVPLLEEASGLSCGRDFFVGYSPERINPGDREHTLAKIVKVVSGQDEATLDLLARLYGAIIPAGIHRAASIRVAEAAKVIENTQRDLNIALMNELAIIFGRLGIDTMDVLEAAGTKWNFLPFRPGLVGGHCIGVDPYYLTHKAEAAGCHPQVILAGRRINDTMGAYVAERGVRLMLKAGLPVNGKSRVAVFGLTFKEDCPDLRNTRVLDIISELRGFGVEPLVHDPVADPGEAAEAYGLTLAPLEELTGLDAIFLAVAHRQYREMGRDNLCGRLVDNGCLVDVKSVFRPEARGNPGPRVNHWRL
jgi:UDP-N-acetyl-D-galactosamine dehydrogenase